MLQKERITVTPASVSLSSYARRLSLPQRIISCYESRVLKQLPFHLRKGKIVA